MFQEYLGKYPVFMKSLLHEKVKAFMICFLKNLGATPNPEACNFLCY